MSKYEWMEDAACRSADPTWFFPLGDKKKITIAQKEEALAFCDDCSVKDKCLNYAIDNDIKEGMWGGLTPQKRKQLIRRRRIA